MFDLTSDLRCSCNRHGLRHNSGSRTHWPGDRRRPRAGTRHWTAPTRLLLLLTGMLWDRRGAHHGRWRRRSSCSHWSWRLSRHHRTSLNRGQRSPSRHGDRGWRSSSRHWSCTRWSNHFWASRDRRCSRLTSRMRRTRSRRRPRHWTPRSASDGGGAGGSPGGRSLLLLPSLHQGLQSPSWPSTSCWRS